MKLKLSPDVLWGYPDLSAPLAQWQALLTDLKDAEGPPDYFRDDIRYVEQVIAQKQAWDATRQQAA